MKGETKFTATFTYMFFGVGQGSPGWRCVVSIVDGMESEGPGFVTFLGDGWKPEEALSSALADADKSGWPLERTKENA